MSKRIAIACQAIALPLRTAVQEHLEALGYEVVDQLTAEEQPVVSFTVAAQRIAYAVTKGGFEKGIVFCGTGMGVSQVVNKYKGVRGALVESPFAARQARIVNDANVLCLGQLLLTPTIACQIVDEFISHEFLEDETEPDSARRQRLEAGRKLLDEIGE